MTLTLIVTRHAKSSWGGPSLDDHARPLNERGRRSAKAIGSWLGQKGLSPDQVLSSSAARTRETWQRMSLNATSVRFLDDLYHASASHVLRVLATAEGKTILLLGHNPGLAVFANQMVKHPPAHTRFSDYPTCATTVMRFDIGTWQDVSWTTGTVLDFVIPRELTG